MRSSSHKGDVLAGDLVNHQQVAFGVAPAVVRRFGLQSMVEPLRGSGPSLAGAKALLTWDGSNGGDRNATVGSSPCGTGW